MYMLSLDVVSIRGLIFWAKYRQLRIFKIYRLGGEVGTKYSQALCEALYLNISVAYWRFRTLFDFISTFILVLWTFVRSAYYKKVTKFRNKQIEKKCMWFPIRAESESFFTVFITELMEQISVFHSQYGEKR